MKPGYEHESEKEQEIIHEHKIYYNFILIKVLLFTLYEIHLSHRWYPWLPIGVLVGPNEEDT